MAQPLKKNNWKTSVDRYIVTVRLDDCANRRNKRCCVQYGFFTSLSQVTKKRYYNQEVEMWSDNLIKKKKKNIPI